MDEYFQRFTVRFGNPRSIEEVPESSYSKYKDILPDRLLSYWKEFGWSSFGNGIVWLTNPDNYEHIVQAWLENIPELKDLDFYVFARSAFGSLYAFQPNTANIIRIIAVHGGVLANKSMLKKQKKNIDSFEKDISIGVFFSSVETRVFDLKDEDSNPMFGKALSNLGELGSNEVYGFKPLLVLGGRESADSLQKVRMDVHLDIMLQFTEPQLYLM